MTDSKIIFKLISFVKLFINSRDFKSSAKFESDEFYMEISLKRKSSQTLRLIGDETEVELLTIQ